MAYLTRSGALLSFVMVRHPLDRLVSAYYDKIIGEPSKTNFKKIVEKIKEKCEFHQIHLDHHKRNIFQMKLLRLK